jgi:hypothetical protein
VAKIVAVKSPDGESDLTIDRSGTPLFRGRILGGWAAPPHMVANRSRIFFDGQTYCDVPRRHRGIAANTALELASHICDTGIRAETAIGLMAQITDLRGLLGNAGIARRMSISGGSAS